MAAVAVHDSLDDVHRVLKHISDSGVRVYANAVNTLLTSHTLVRWLQRVFRVAKSMIASQAGLVLLTVPRRR